MYTVIRNDNLGANTKSANILSGDINEFVSVDSAVTVYSIASATGVRLTCYADSDIAIDDKEIPNIATSLDKSAHLLDSFIVAGGTRLAIFLRETAGVATTDMLTGVEVIPI